MAKPYDTIIIGAGPAGMAASIYCSRYKLKHLIFGEKVGGQFVDAVAIENYPGFTSISGLDLADNFRRHVEAYGVKIRSEKVKEIKKKGGVFIVTAGGGDVMANFSSRSLILAMGGKHRHLGVPGEEEFNGRGVSYCATCDAPLFKGKTVAVVGGGNSALTSAIHLASFAKKVYLIHRRGEYRAAPIWVERMRAAKNIEEVLNNTVKEIQGRNNVEQIVLSNPVTQLFPPGKKVPRSGFLPGNPVTLPVKGIFFEVGMEPQSGLAQDLGVKLDREGAIKVKPDYSTNVAGVFAAGDIIRIAGGVELNQIVNSAGQGAEAATSAYNYICQLETCKSEEAKRS